MQGLWDTFLEVYEFAAAQQFKLADTLEDVQRKLAYAEHRYTTLTGESVYAMPAQPNGSRWIAERVAATAYRAVATNTELADYDELQYRE